MPICMCGHEAREHNDFGVCGIVPCMCMQYAERPNYARTTSFTDLPVSQGARDLYDRLLYEMQHHPDDLDGLLETLAAADEKDVRSLLWARRTGKL